MVQREENIRVHPYGSLETDRECTFEDEEHRRCGGTGTVFDRGVELHLADEAGLNSHDNGHEGDHREELYISSISPEICFSIK